ncbi:hypothetical protein Gotur_006463 [Gossypium turneri]
MYKKSLLNAISNVIGWVVKIDYNIDACQAKGINDDANKDHSRKNSATEEMNRRKAMIKRYFDDGAVMMSRGPKLGHNNSFIDPIPIETGLDKGCHQVVQFAEVSQLGEQQHRLDGVQHTIEKLNNLAVKEDNVF